MSAYFHPPQHLSPLDPACASIFGALNGGLSGIGTVVVNASKRGMRIAFNGKTIARGRTPQELHDAFQAAASAAASEQTTEN